MPGADDAKEQHPRAADGTQNIQNAPLPNGQPSGLHRHPLAPLHSHSDSNPADDIEQLPIDTQHSLLSKTHTPITSRGYYSLLYSLLQGPIHRPGKPLGAFIRRPVLRNRIVEYSGRIRHPTWARLSTLRHSRRDGLGEEPGQCTECGKHAAHSGRMRAIPYSRGARVAVEYEHFQVPDSAGLLAKHMPGTGLHRHAVSGRIPVHYEPKLKPAYCSSQKNSPSTSGASLLGRLASFFCCS